jgi:hypothetical protein
MVDLSTRVYDFYSSLAEFNAEHRPSWQADQMFNAQLNQAKAQMPDDAVVSAISEHARRSRKPALETRRLCADHAARVPPYLRCADGVRDGRGRQVQR